MGLVWRWVVGKPQFMDPCIATFEGHTDRVTNLAYSHDEALVISGGGAKDKTVKIWDAESGLNLATLEGHTDCVSCVRFAPQDVTVVASASFDMSIRLWRVPTRQCYAVLQGDGHSEEGHTAAVTCLAFHPHDKKLVSGGADFTVRVWDMDTRQCLQVIRDGIVGPVNLVAYSPGDGAHLALFASDDSVNLLGEGERQPQKFLCYARCTVTSLCFSPDGERVAAVCDEEKPIKVFDLTGYCTNILDSRCADYPCIAYSPDGRHMATAYEDKTVKIYEVETGNCRTSLEGHEEGFVSSMAYAAKTGTRLATGGSNRTIKVGLTMFRLDWLPFVQVGGSVGGPQL
jgi:WD40 repeat protein